MSVSILDRPPLAPSSPPPAIHRVFIVSPHQMIRAGLESMLSSESHLRLGVAGPSAPDGLLTPSRHAGGDDVALIDSACIDAPMVDELTCAIEQPRLVVMVLARAHDPALTDRALDLGADCCVSLGATRTELSRAITAAQHTRRQAVGSPDNVEHLLNPFPAAMDRVTDSLSPRELQVLAAVALGLSTRQVAERNFISIDTVKSYIQTAYRKIGVVNRAQATLWGIEHRVSDLDRRARLCS